VIGSLDLKHWKGTERFVLKCSKKKEKFKISNRHAMQILIKKFKS